MVEINFDEKMLALDIVMRDICIARLRELVDRVFKKYPNIIYFQLEDGTYFFGRATRRVPVYVEKDVVYDDISDFMADWGHRYNFPNLNERWMRHGSVEKL